MSTRASIKYEHDPATGQGFHLYREAFDEAGAFVYLELDGFPFEAVSSIELSASGPTRLAVRLPEAVAQRLGLLPPAAKDEKR